MTFPAILGKYQNGNYQVTLYEDGTKVRETDANAFIPEFPESFDCKITNVCDLGCQFCHEKSTPDGAHGNILDAAFIDTLKPYTEIAIGGGNVLEHPDLNEFLEKLQERKVIANMTVNRVHFEREFDRIEYLVQKKLVHGLGVSVNDDVTDDLIRKLQSIPNSVVHVINGVISLNNLKKLMNHNLKLLILGYKDYGRGRNYMADYKATVELHILMMQKWLPILAAGFAVISFDNLAIRQLNPKSLMTDEEWQTFYMGDDGQYTLYVDLINRQYASNSTSDLRFPLLNSMDNMFNIIRRKNIDATCVLQ